VLEVLQKGLTADALVVDEPGDFRVHTRAYTDSAVYQAELDRIFGAGWVYVAHEAEIPEPGDYRTTTIGTQPVVVTRSDDGAIHVLFNRCRHRGSVLCRDERGRSATFRCPYHSWVYANDGRLLGYAQRDGYDPERMHDLGMLSPARVGVYRGLIFANGSPEGISLKERLRYVQRYIDLWIERSPTGRITFTRSKHKIAYPGNWKFQMENGADGYHGNYVHESFLDIVQRAGETTVSAFTNLRTTGSTRGLPYGDGFIDRPSGGMAGQFDYQEPRHAAYHERLEAAYGHERMLEILGQRNLLIFPNLFLFESHVRVIRPVSIDQSVVEMHPTLLNGVPDGFNEARLRTHERFFGPAGFGAPDDVEMFVNNAAGLRANAVDWVMMSRGMHRETINVDGEMVGHSTDEEPQRAMYRAWKAAMRGVAV
jgi:benzoate/toluate 1,2-dioxygenase alpha subunit